LNDERRRRTGAHRTSLVSFREGLHRELADLLAHQRADDRRVEDGKPFYELDSSTRQARIFDRTGGEFPAEGFRGRHPPLVQHILTLTFFLQKVCP